jgi:hypothetical protein
MKVIEIEALSAATKNDKTLVLVRHESNLALVEYSRDFENGKQLLTLDGKNGHILITAGNLVLLSIDDNLTLFDENLGHKIVLNAHSRDNAFMHACEFNGKILVQEYGLPPTSIYASDNLEKWTEFVSNLSIDRDSKHFHYITYDAYHKKLIVTLGDGNLVRAACFDQAKSAWQNLFCGAWQFYPILPMNDRIVFGFDSALIVGGLGVYYPSKNNWKFTFLKWTNKDMFRAQMSDIKYIAGFWLAYVASPRAILVSDDLKNWYSLHIENSDQQHFVPLGFCETNSQILCCTGTKLLLFEKQELMKAISTTNPVMFSSNDYSVRVKGLLWVWHKKIRRALRKNPRVEKGFL